MKGDSQTCSLSFYHLLMTDGFPASSPSPDYTFGNRCPDSIRHGESLPHSSSSKERQSFHYPRSYASHIFHSGEVPTREEDSISWVEVHKLSISALIKGDKPPSPLITVCRHLLSPCFLDNLPSSYRGELRPLIRTLLGDPSGGFPRDLKPKGCLSPVPGWERWSQFVLFFLNPY